MSIVDIINEKTGKFANNIAEAVADLLGHDLKATSIVENIGEGNNIQEALDNISGKSSNNIAEAIDNYYDQEHLGTTISDALERAGDEPGPEPPGPGPEPPGPDPDFDHMTKAELQQYADSNYISGVDQNSQTKAEMIYAITTRLAARLLDDTLVGQEIFDYTPIHTFSDLEIDPPEFITCSGEFGEPVTFQRVSQSDTETRYDGSIEGVDINIIFINESIITGKTIRIKFYGSTLSNIRMVIDPVLD